MKRTITTPIVLLKIQGNHKNKASAIGITAIASWEPNINTTYVVVNVQHDSLGNPADFVKPFYAEGLGIDENNIEAQYSESGIDFITK